MIRWRTLADGRVEVDRGAGPSVPELSGADAATRRVDRWREMAAPIAAAKGVPLSWALGFMYSESGGNPAALSPVGAVGLLQIMPSTARMSEEQLLDPRTNLTVGLGLLGDSRRLGWDLVASASRYNAGMRADGSPHPSQRSPWGVREDKGYIDRVVRSVNWYTRLETPPVVPPSGSGGVPPLGLMLAIASAVYDEL